MRNEGQADEDAGTAGTRPFLPPEISFLAFHGTHLTTLWEAGRLSARTGVSADRALLSHGLVTEENFYRALANEMRLPFLELAQIAPSPDARGTACRAEGRVPLVPEKEDAPHTALAPRGEDLLALLGSRNRNIAGLAVVTPTALRQAIFAAGGQRIAADAADGLSRRDRDLCFRGGLSREQVTALAVAAAAVAVALALYTAAALLILSLLLSVPFLVLTTLRIKASVTPAPAEPLRRPPRADDRDLPVYTVIVPLYRERRILSRLTGALQALDYPPTKLDIKLVIEADDHETSAALAEIVLPGCFEVVTAPPGEPRTKPRALNVALPLARGEYTVVYDAEDVPDAGQLRLAVSTFAGVPQDVACLQARLTIDNEGDSRLTKLFAIEYAALFDVINPALAAMACPVPLGGTSNHFRTRVLREAGAWDAWNVTEDADLGLRLARLGFHVADLPSSTHEEAPSGLRAWMHQRSRWMKGFIQTCITHSRHPVQTWRQLGPKRFMCGMAVTFGTVLSALGFPFFTAAAAIALFNGMLNPVTGLEVASMLMGTTLMVAGLFAMFAPALEGLRRRGRRDLWPYVALLPAYYVLVSLASWRGLIELIRSPSHWNKTEHGLARTSRRGLLVDMPVDAPAPAQAAAPASYK